MKNERVIQYTEAMSLARAFAREHAEKERELGRRLLKILRGARGPETLNEIEEAARSLGFLDLEREEASREAVERAERGEIP